MSSRVCQPDGLVGGNRHQSAFAPSGLLAEQPTAPRKSQGSKVFAALPLPTPAQDRSTPSPRSLPTLTPLKRPSGTPTRSVAHLPNLLICLITKPAADQHEGDGPQEGSMSLLDRLHRMKAELSEGENDPWMRLLERALPGSLTCISTVALLALLDFPLTTGNARRLARTMRSMGWVGIKSRRLAPGGWRATECRGWVRPVRDLKQKEACHVS
jgi:hypothetical protein